MEGKKETGVFLKRHGLDLSGIDPERELSKLLGEMEEAYRGEKRSLKMIPYYIGRYRPPKQDRLVTVVDIGGTHVRSAVAVLGRDGSVATLDYRSFPRPGGAGPMSTAQFFDEIAEQMRGQLETERLGICFSLATLPQPDGDAVITAGGKQIQIVDMLGKKVGENLREAAARTGAGHVRGVVVVNDTVAATLGGASFRGRDAWGEPIGFVYGTGVNLAYPEADGRLVNTEIGAYGGFPAGDLDDRYDATLIDPGEDRFEKMVSGGYQGGLCRILFEAAFREGFLVSPAFGAGLTWEGLDSRDISAFLLDPEGENRIARACKGAEDRAFLIALFEALTQRSACLCSIALTAAMRRSEGARFHITAEGSTYQKQPGFARRLEAHLDSLAVGRFGFSYQIGTVPDAVLRGTAAACL